MTDRQMLGLLVDFYRAQMDVAIQMSNVLYMFERGQEIPTWYALFQWCEAKDEREEFWSEFKHHYPDAIALKEGVSYDQY